MMKRMVIVVRTRVTIQIMWTRAVREGGRERGREKGREGGRGCGRKGRKATSYWNICFCEQMRPK